MAIKPVFPDLVTYLVCAIQNETKTYSGIELFAISGTVLLKSNVAYACNFAVINECISSPSSAYQAYLLHLDFWLLEIKTDLAKESSAT